MKYSVSSTLKGMGMPVALVNCAVSAAPYAPAVVVLASGGVAGAASSASFIVLSQVTDCIFCKCYGTVICTPFFLTYQ